MPLLLSSAARFTVVDLVLRTRAVAATKALSFFCCFLGTEAACCLGRVLGRVLSPRGGGGIGVPGGDGGAGDTGVAGRDGGDEGVGVPGRDGGGEGVGVGVPGRDG